MKTKSKYTAIKPDSNGFINYPAIDHETWSILINQQDELIKGRACTEYIEGLKKLNFSRDKIPQHDEVTKVLKKETGWAVEPVEAIISADEFFTLLSEKKFPAASFIRTRAELKYIKEPDIFHEFYGHCPLITNQNYADYLEAYGKMALKVSGKDRLRLFRLFWFTIEFGLIKTDQGLRIYGGGILSSPSETVHALENKEVEYQDLDALTALRTPYRIDIEQPLYFVIESFEHLFEMIKKEDILSYIPKSYELGSFEPKFPPIEKEVSNEISSC